MKVTQPSNGSTAGRMSANLPSTVKWLGGTEIVYTRGDSTVDFVDLYFDGTDWFAEGKNDFKVA